MEPIKDLAVGACAVSSGISMDSFKNALPRHLARVSRAPLECFRLSIGFSKDRVAETGRGRGCSLPRRDVNDRYQLNMRPKRMKSRTETILVLSCWPRLRSPGLSP